MNLARLLLMSDNPPSTAGGAPVISKALLRHYPSDRLHVLCDRNLALRSGELVRSTLLQCPHTTIANVERVRLRPRRYVPRIAAELNLLRVGRIAAAAERIVERKGIEAILTLPWRAEFAIAALDVSRRTGIPLYVFEMDDWEAMNPHGRAGRRIRETHGELLRHAERVWLISPSMIESYRERYGVEGEFLFHFVDLAARLEASARGKARQPHDEHRLVYTGAINAMFADTMRCLCRLINDGVSVDGRPVCLDIYSGACPTGLEGPAVRYRGFVSSDEIPELLGRAHATIIAVSFSAQPEIDALVRTSIYTKTIDYLAAGRPVLTIAPRHAAQVAYFGAVSTVVDSNDRDRWRAGIATVLRTGPDVQALRRAGLELVAAEHSLEALHTRFLSAFEIAT